MLSVPVNPREVAASEPYHQAELYALDQDYIPEVSISDCHSVKNRMKRRADDRYITLISQDGRLLPVFSSAEAQFKYNHAIQRVISFSSLIAGFLRL
jgi:hypothetical protein